MNTKVNLHICKKSSPDDTEYVRQPCLDGDDYLFVEQLIRRERLHPNFLMGELGSTTRLAIYCDLDHPALRQILDILNRNDYHPYPSMFLPKDSPPNIYPILHVRSWDSYELDSSPLLRFQGWEFGEGPLIVVVGYDGDSPIGGVAFVEDEEDSRWHAAYGNVSGNSYFAVSSKSKKIIEQEVKGCRFIPVKWDEPLRAKADFWVLDSSIILPPCLTPRVMDGTSWFWDDAGGWPEVLEFDQNAVQFLGEFDIARTHEILGDTTEGKAEYRGPHLIVSQKFRDVLTRIWNAPESPPKFCPVKLRD